MISLVLTSVYFGPKYGSLLSITLALLIYLSSKKHKHFLTERQHNLRLGYIIPSTINRKSLSTLSDVVQLYVAQVYHPACSKERLGKERTPVPSVVRLLGHCPASSCQTSHNGILLKYHAVEMFAWVPRPVIQVKLKCSPTGTRNISVLEGSCCPEIQAHI